MGERDERNRSEFGLKRDHRCIENRSGGTHPGAEQGAMRSSLMLGMVPGMLDRLCLCQSPDEKDREHEENRQEFEERVFHRKTTSMTRLNSNEHTRGLSRRWLDLGTSAYYRIQRKDAVYCAKYFRRHRRSF